MQRSAFSFLPRTAAFAATMLALVALHAFIMRPWYSSWGAAPADLTKALPGDELLPEAPPSTVAVTIDAPVAVVWAWLTQVGHDRGGFGRYEPDVTKAGAPVARDLTPGDALFVVPGDRLRANGRSVLVRNLPERALVFSGRKLGTSRTLPFDRTATFALESIDAAHTRLLERERVGQSQSLAGKALDQLIGAPTHFAMVRKHVESVAAYAEGRAPSSTRDAAELGAFLACFVLFCDAAFRLLRRRDVLRGACTLFAVGAFMQLLMFVQPPWFVGCLVVPMLALYGDGSRFSRRARSAVPQPTA